MFKMNFQKWSKASLITMSFGGMLIFWAANALSAETITDQKNSSLLLIRDKPVSTGSLLGSVKPVLAKDGQIICGAKSIRQTYMSPPYHALDVMLQGGDICTGSEFVDLGAGMFWTLGYIPSSRKEIISGNSKIYTADARAGTASSEKLGMYALSLTYLENGLAKVESRLALDNPSVLKNRAYTFAIPTYLMVQGIYVEDGKTVAFDSTINKAFGEDKLKGLKIIFFPNNEEARFSIEPGQCSNIKISGGKISFSPDRNGIISFLIDISCDKKLSDNDISQTAPNGINTWTADRLHLPDYDASPNLVQNPSFESGLRYWAYRIFAGGSMPLKYADIYELDTTVAHSGRNSLRIRALPIDNTLPLGNYPVPFVVGENYTLSFYAKGSSNNGLTLNVHGRGGLNSRPFGQTANRSSDVGTYAVGKEWQRYSFPFSALEKFITMYFTAKASSQAEEEYVWVDDVQIEKGAMTEFKQAPHAMQLISAARGNFLEYGQHPDLRLALQSRPNTAGTVLLSIEDFFFHTVLQKDFKFKTDADGKATIGLSALDSKVTGEKLRGVFSVSSTLKIDGDERAYRDYFRFSVMNFLENKHKNKDLFNLTFSLHIQAGGPDMERFLFRERAIGFGSGSYPWTVALTDGYPLDEERACLIQKYGIELTGGVCVLNLWAPRFNGGVSEGDLMMTNIKNKINPSDEDLALFEKICEEKARRRPWNKIWYFFGESNPGLDPLQSHPESFAKFLIATLRGIKKGNPSAKVLIEGGPWSIAANAGLKWTERYIQDVKKIDPTARFDGAAGHFYCDIPESYDLDENVGAYIKMLDRNSCENWPVYLNEGGNYSPMNIPSLGVSPYIAHSANGWYISPFSYDIGKAERISAAFTARTWLVGLKYQDRVACMNDFYNPSRYMDIDFTPRAYEKIPNTLGRLLGDASFYKDIRFAPFCRCYVFKDDKTGAPIAAIWGHKESVDRWKEEPPQYKFDFGRQEIKFMDLMENETSFSKDADGFTVIPMSPFPLFIKGAPGAEQVMCDAIASAVPAVGTAGSVEVSAFPNADGNASVVFTSKVSREYTGDAKVIINGVEKKWPLKMQPLGNVEESVVSASATECGKIRKFSAEYNISGASSGKIAGDYIVLKKHEDITVDGNLSDWKDLPAIDLAAGISMSVVTAGKKVIIAIRASAKDVLAEDLFAGVGLYIDPFEKTGTWTESKTAAGIAGDLGVYEIRKSKDGGMEALCRFSQGLLAGMDKDLMIIGKGQKLITVKTAKVGDEACMEVEVPEKIFAPAVLEPGGRFGLNISIPLKGGAVALAPISGAGAAEPGRSIL